MTVVKRSPVQRSGKFATTVYPNRARIPTPKGREGRSFVLIRSGRVGRKPDRLAELVIGMAVLGVACGYALGSWLL